MVQHMRRLKLDERVRLTPQGATCRVARVNACAAYLRPVNAVPVTVTVGDRTFLAHEGGGLVAVSPCAFVYREDA